MERVDFLRASHHSCYGLRLNPSAASVKPPTSVSIRITGTCHGQFCSFVFFLAFLLFFAVPDVLSHKRSQPTAANAPGTNDIRFTSDTQSSNGELKHLRGHSKIETSQMLISADEIDFNEDTHIAVARGHLHFEHYLNGDKIEADHGEYNLQTQDGKFYDARDIARESDDPTQPPADHQPFLFRR